MLQIKIFDLHPFERIEKAELKEAILLKNNGVKQLVENGKSLEIIYIDDKNKSAVLKISPEIRHKIMKQGTVFIDMQAHIGILLSVSLVKDLAINKDQSTAKTKLEVIIRCIVVNLTVQKIAHIKIMHLIISV